MLIIWLQGIWLPLHGYSFEETPLWAGIYMLPLTVGFLIAGPTAGYLSDRFGARLFSTTGLVLLAASFVGLMAIPVDFDYSAFALLLLLSGLGQGMFSAPNTAAIMGSVEPAERGVASGMRSTLQNSGTALSIGVFFSLMIAGLASSMPSQLSSGLQAHGVPHHQAEQVAGLPPVSTLFATFLGENPIKHLLGGTLANLSPADAATLTGHEFFPRLVAGPFHHGLTIVFTAATLMALVGAVASLSRGRHQRAVPPDDADSAETSLAEATP
jgi:MFS family permease